MASIGSLLFDAVANTTKLITQLEKDGGKAGSKAAGSFSKSFGTALKAGLTTFASGAFAIAAGNMVMLQQATAKLRAETGLTAAEADKAGKAINRMAGANLQSVEQIGDAYSKVVTDLGLTGEAADIATEAFLRFATATGQDAAGAVSAFDDILDAWELEASDATEIMDILTKSHQEFGGSVEDNQRNLSDLAPSLKAMNVPLDDAIGLLNLFAASGVDASKAQLAFNSAVAKLPPGTNLMDFLETLQRIEDPGERARKAIEVFGSRAGAGLANALGPGKGALEDYVISAEEATGATEAAADAMESDLLTRGKLALKGFASAVTEFMGPAGPIITGFASLASLGSTLGLDKVFKGLATSAPVKAAAKAAGLAIGAVFHAAMFVAEKLATFATTAISAIASTPAVVKATGMAGQVLGTTFAQRFIAALGPIGLALYALTNTEGSEARDLADEVLAKYHAGLEGGRSLVEAGYDSAIVTPLYEANARAKVAAEQGTTEIAEVYGPPFAAKLSAGIVSGIDSQGNVVPEAVAGLFTRAEASATLQAEASASIVGRATTFAFAKGISTEAGREAVDQSWENLLALIEDSESVTAQTAKLIGELTGDTLADALTDKDPRVRKAAEDQKGLIIEQLENLNVRAGTLSPQAAEAIATGLTSKDKDIAEWAGKKYLELKGSIPNAPDMKKWAQAAIDAYAQGLIESESKVYANAKRVLAGVKGVFQAYSPPGPESPLHEIDIWGRKTGEAWTSAFVEAIAKARGIAIAQLGQMSRDFQSWEEAFTTGGLAAAQDFLLTDASRPTGGHYENPAPGVWNWVPDPVTGPQPSNLTTPGAQMADQFLRSPNGTAAVAPGGSGSAQGVTMNITVNNPAPEPASQSIRQRLQLAGVGLGTS